MTGSTALAAEIDRIASSPYPSQLRTLHTLMQKCSDADIAQWAAANPCRIDTLSSCLLEGLQQWNYVLDIVTTFSSSATCRNALLRQEPTLLHTAVAMAIKPGDDRSTYVRASVALLSHPLPDTVALPAEAQTLFIQLVEDAARRPCPASIQPLHLILSGTGGVLLAVLSSDTMSRFEDHLLEILKNSSTTPDGCLSLYCLAIMNLVCASTDLEFRLTAGSYNTQDFLASTPVSTRWKSEAMQQFFTGSKAQKSIQLVVLSAYLASKATSKDCTPEKIKSLVLANEIVAAIPAEIRKIWSSANLGMLRKLQERLCADDVEERVRTLALRFVGKLCELDTLPHPILERLEGTFLEADQMKAIHVLCPHVDDSTLFAGVLTRTSIDVLLHHATDYALGIGSAELAAGADAIEQTVSSAAAMVGSLRLASHQIKDLLADQGFIQKLTSLNEMIQTPQQCTELQRTAGHCCQAVRAIRSRLAYQIVTLLLRALQLTSLDSQAITLLLELHAQSARNDIACHHGQQTWGDLAKIATVNAVEPEGEEFDWREALQMHFKARATVEQDSVSRLFAKACANLEARCEIVEKPLREEREKSRALEEHNSALTRAFEESEANYVEATVQFQALERREQGMIREIKAARDENVALLERITLLEEKLRDSQVEAQNQLAEMKSAKQSAELNAAAQIACKQEALEDAEEETAQWKAKFKELSTKLSSFENGLHEAEIEQEQLRECLSRREAQVRELESDLENSATELTELKRLHEELRQELRSTSSDDAEKLRLLAELREELQSCRNEREEIRAQLQRETQELRHVLEQRQREYDDLAQQSRQSNDQLQTAITHLRHELSAITASNAAEVEQRGAKISELRKRVDRYQRKCQEKDHQIAEAESMRANLMAAMGIRTSQSRAGLAYRSRDVPTQQTQTPTQVHAPAGASRVEDGGGLDLLSVADFEQSFVSDADGRQREQQEEEEEEEEGEGEKSGPTPKRSRPRKSLSFAAPLTTNARMRASVAAAGGGGAAERRLTRASSSGLAGRQSLGRQPLGAVSGNRAAVVKGFKMPIKAGESAAEEEEESTFEGSEIFAGTQCAEMLDGFGDGV